MVRPPTARIPKKYQLSHPSGWDCFSVLRCTPFALRQALSLSGRSPGERDQQLHRTGHILTSRISPLQEPRKNPTAPLELPTSPLQNHTSNTTHFPKQFWSRTFYAFATGQSPSGGDQTCVKQRTARPGSFYLRACLAKISLLIMF